MTRDRATTPPGRPAAGGGRWVLVAPERLEGWLAGFAARHGQLRWTVTQRWIEVHAADGAQAHCEIGFPPLPFDPAAPYGGLVGHALAPRRVGVLLVRLGGFAVGICDDDVLVSAKVGSRPVHGRSAAGGWSQHRFARRREGQAALALRAAADAAARVLVCEVASLDAVLAGGDRSAVSAVLADPRLAGVRALLGTRLLEVGEPRLKALQAAPAALRAVRIRVLDPPAAPPPDASRQPPPGAPGGG